MSRTMRGESVAVYLEARAILALIGPDHDADQHIHDAMTELGGICRIEGCDRDRHGKGLCDTHYRAHQRAHIEAHTINRVSQ